MSKLGDFLEAVYGPSEGFETLRASIRHQRRRELAESARSGRPVFGKRKVPEDSPPRPDESLLSVWIELPGRLRIETEQQRGEQSRSTLTVLDGGHSWTRDDQGHVEEDQASGQKPGRGAAAATVTERHFSHARLRELFGALALEAIGDVRIAGHDCLSVRACPRPGGLLWPHWLPYGADEYEFDVLPARGLVLAIRARHQDTVFEVNEVNEVVFDERLDDGLFRYTPGYGEQVRPATPIVERLSLEAAVRRMAFPVLIPKEVPDADHAHVEVMYHPPRIPSTRPYLALMYRWDGREQSLWLQEAATVDAELEKLEWETISRNGRELRLSDPDVEGGRRGVALEQAGTHVTIWSDIAREPLLDLASSLVPATG